MGTVLYDCSCLDSVGAEKSNCARMSFRTLHSILQVLSPFQTKKSGIDFGLVEQRFFHKKIPFTKQIFWKLSVSTGVTPWRCSTILFVITLAIAVSGHQNLCTAVVVEMFLADLIMCTQIHQLSEVVTARTSACFHSLQMLLVRRELHAVLFLLFQVFLVGSLCEPSHAAASQLKSPTLASATANRR